jgi:hypothetical protein
MNEPEAAISPARPERKATLRLGQNGLNIILTVVILCIALPLLFIGYRVALNFKSKRDITLAESNLHGLYQALYHYSLDWDGKLPPAESWTDDAAGYLPSASGIAGGKESYLQGPGDGDAIRYEYNDLAAGFDMQDERERKADPKDLVLLIERPGAKPNTHVAIPYQGNAQSESALFKLLTFPHYSDDPDNATTVILYASGAVSVRTRKDFRAD